MSHLEVRSLSAQDADGVAIEDVSFAVEEGRIAAIVGAPGSGTRATLRLIAGLDRQDSGDVLLGERTLTPIPAHQRVIGMVSGDLALFPNMDVRGNVAFGLRMRGWPRANRESRVNVLLEEFGLSESARLRPDALSDTDRLRVALARALAPMPSLLLLDLPLARIDDARREAMREELRRSLRDAERTTLLATHDLRDAAAIADDLIVMDEGRVLQSGPLARVLAGPSSVRVAAMVGYAVLVHGEVRGGYVVEESVGAVRVPDGFPLEHAAVVLAHPSTLLGVPAGSNLGSGVLGEVRRVRPHGPMYLLDVQVAERSIEVRWEWDLRSPAVGTRVEIAARPGTLRFFNAPWSTTAPAPTPEEEQEQEREHEQEHEREDATAAEAEPEAEAEAEAEAAGEPIDAEEAAIERNDEDHDDGDEDGTDEDAAEPEPDVQLPASAIPPGRSRGLGEPGGAPDGTSGGGARRPDGPPAAPKPRHPQMPIFD
jgi:thiamine transport system ATP-binding protein